MAISPDFPGLTLSLQIAHRKLPEYHDSDIEDPPRAVSYMIEAIPDAIFSIQPHTTPEAHFTGSSIALHFYVDGIYVDGTLIDATSGTGQCESRGRYVSQNQLRRYQFASREKQIELVEKHSTSLSNLPRKSGTSSKSPQVSYGNFESRNIDSAAPSNLEGTTANTLSEYEDTAGRASPEIYRSIAESVQNGMPMPSNDAYRDFVPPPLGDSRSVMDQEYHSTTLRRKNPLVADGPALPIRTAADRDGDPPIDPKRIRPTQPAPIRQARRPAYQSTFRSRPSPLTGMTNPSNSNENMPSVPEATTFPARQEYVSRYASNRPPARNPAALSTAKNAPTSTTSNFTESGTLVNHPLSSTATNDVSSATAGSKFTAPEELGTIKIIVCHVNKKGAVPFGQEASPTAMIGDGVVDAVKDKSGGLLVRFKSPDYVAPITTWDVGAVNENDDDGDEGDSSVTYLYHYRTREMLEALDLLSQEVKQKEPERIRPPPIFTCPSGIAAFKGGEDSTMMEGIDETSVAPERKMRKMNESTAQNVRYATDAEIKDGGSDVEEEKEVMTGGKVEVDDEEGEDDDWEMVDHDRSAA